MEWRELARKVPGILLAVSDGAATGPLPWTLTSGYRKLVALVYKSRRVLMGDQIGAIPEPPPAGYGPHTLIDRARRVFDGLKAHHAAAGHVFVLYGTRFGLLQGDPLWQRWEGHRADALRHAAEALRGLRYATSRYQASGEALRMALSFPPWSTGWHQWRLAALHLTRRAVWGATEAALSLGRMRRAVALEFFDAWMVLRNR